MPPQKFDDFRLSSLFRPPKGRSAREVFRIHIHPFVNEDLNKLSIFFHHGMMDDLERIAPLNSGVPGDQLGFILGDPAAAVRGVGCVWSVHTDSIRRCAERGLNMIICHEDPFLPPQTSPWYDSPGEAEIHSNRVRRRLLDEHGMVVYRSHSNWDALREHGIADSAVAALGIEGLRTVARQKFFSVEELPRDMTVRELRSRAEAGFGFTDTRLFGDADLSIRRFALLIGGFGENQYHMPQVAKEMGAQALIIGEMSEFIVIAALELGLSVIETLHSMSEIPGIRAQARLLAQRFPEVRVEYIPSGAMSFQQILPN